MTLLQSLLSNIASRSAPRRALFSNLTFEIGPGLRISVKGFIILKRQEPIRSSYVYIGGEKAEIAVGSSTLLAEDTARTVEKVEVRKAFKFGGETVSFSKDEMAQIRNFGDPVLRVVGFKPMSLLPSWANVKPSTFIYPSEEQIIGSTRVFSALHQKLLKDQTMAIAWYIPRRNATPTLAAILPGAERTDEEGNQTMPPGLWIHVLPFADDVRQPPDVSVIRSPDDLINGMRDIVQQLQLPKGVYDPTKYPNPSLQWFYRILQALALDEDLPEKPDDKTIPRHRQIDKRAGQYVLAWGQQLEEEYQKWQRDNKTAQKTVTGASKRSAVANGEAVKKAKTTAGANGADEAMGDDEMRMHFEKDSIRKLTVPVLKAFAQSKGISLAGASKKDTIVDAVTGYFETKMQLD